MPTDQLPPNDAATETLVEITKLQTRASRLLESLEELEVRVRAIDLESKPAADAASSAREATACARVEA